MRAARSIGVALFVVMATLALPLQAQANRGANGKIAFTTNRDGNSEIYTMSQVGGGQTNVTNHTAADTEPSWSNGGFSLLFDSTRDGNQEIYRLTSGSAARLTNNAASDSAAAWSSLSSRIAFVTDRDGNSDVYTMTGTGAGPTNLTANPAADTAPAWSPSGQSIAFVSDRDGNSEIYVMNADGSGLVRLTNHGAVDSQPSWSPHEDQIVFASDRDGNEEIYVMNADGSGQTRITADAASDRDPVWSPDGNKVAFVSDRDGNDDIYTMLTDGSGQRNLTNNPADDGEPTWENPYDVPRQAESLDVSLVPAFRQTISALQCSSRGGTATTHAAPLAFTSCNPPAHLPATPAAFGIRSQGSVQIDVLTGNPATVADELDYAITVDLSDLRNGAAVGPDYNPNPVGPDVTLALRIRITDTLNGPAQTDGATVSDVELAAPVDCQNTADTNLGASCSANTSADAIFPGVAREGASALIAVFRVKLRDSGNDAVRGTTDDREFAMQGSYLP